jgi:hypothetical protein
MWRLVCVLQFVPGLLLPLLAICSQAYPIQVHDELQYETPAHNEQLVHYEPHVQYTHEPEEHEVAVHHNVSSPSGEK